MSDTNDAASKTEEPTPRKLQQAREKGEVVKTPDLGPLASLAGAATVIVLSGGYLSRHPIATMTPFLAAPDSMSFDGQGGMQIMRQALLAVAPVMGAVMLAACAAGVAGNLVQTGLMFSPERLALNFEKVSPA